MQDSSAFQFLAIDQIHESATNPRHTFDEAKLYELADSIKHNGLIQPITVRPNNERFEIVAGARRYRAAQLAELFSVPARIVEIDDAKALEWQLVENSQRVDVHPVPTMPRPQETETEEEAAEREAQFERQRAEYEEERRRREDERKQQFEREQAEYEAERNRRAELLKARRFTFERVLENAPPSFSPIQLRVFIRALINLDPYEFIDDVAEQFAGDSENNQKTAEGILLSALTETADEKLTSFALRLALTGYVAIPREDEADFLTEAAAAFIPPTPVEEKKPKRSPTPIKAAPKKGATKKKVAT